MLPTLMWWGSRTAAASKSRRRCRSDAVAALVAGVDEPVHEELELEVLEAGVVEDRLHLARACASRAGARGRRARSRCPSKPTFAASAQRSRQANSDHSRPTCTSTGPGQRPVQAHQLDVAHRSLLLAGRRRSSAPRAAAPGATLAEPNAAPGALPSRAGLLADSCCVIARDAPLPAGDRPGVDRHLDPGHERGVVGAQPDHRGGHLARLAEARHRLRAEDLAPGARASRCT